jgi:hypothetical protein
MDEVVEAKEAVEVVEAKVYMEEGGSGLIGSNHVLVSASQ